MLYSEIHDGMHVEFYCKNYKEDLSGPEQISCTSYGNYSASPPVCRKRPDRGGGSGSGSGSSKSFKPILSR